MKILILEDDPTRHREFRQNLLNATEVRIVETVPAAIFELKKQKWDTLFLDHDLGGESFVDSNKKPTGYDVAKWLEENPEYKPSNIIIHSLNFVGAARMKAALPDAILAPWAWMNIKLEQNNGIE